MKEEILLTKKTIKANKCINKIQKQNKVKRFYFKSRYPKACIPKIINCKGFHDLLNNDFIADYFINPDNDLFTNIKMCGLKGRSGNGFLTYKKLETFMKSQKENRKIIINAIECDPGLIHDEWILKNKYKEIVSGIHLLQKMLDTKDIIVAVKETSNSNNFGSKIVTLPNLYPLGEEHILIKKVLGIDLEKSEIPAQNGILVINIQTVLAIYEISNYSFIEGSKYITVADYTTGEAMVTKIKNGMNAIKVLQDVLGVRTGKSMFIGSGVLAGAHLLEEKELVTEETSFIAYGKQLHFTGLDSCKKCGSCSRNCPMGIAVKDIIAAKCKNSKVDTSTYKVNQCIKCATCTYQCKAGINVMQYISEK